MVTPAAVHLTTDKVLLFTLHLPSRGAVSPWMHASFQMSQGAKVLSLAHIKAPRPPVDAPPPEPKRCVLHSLFIPS
jgi:hypothetical protein